MWEWGKQKQRKGQTSVDTQFFSGSQMVWAERKTETLGVMLGGEEGGVLGMPVHACVRVKEKWGCAICERVEYTYGV